MAESAPVTVSLVGMPGAGKSTVGVLLAKRLGLGFVDTDLEIQVREGCTLQEFVDARGYRALRRVEEEILLDVALQSRVVATGGSVVYSAAVMARLAGAGPVVYLRAELPILESRVAAAPLRGIASDPDQSYAEVYAERTPLYERYADLAIATGGMKPEQVAEEIARVLRPD